MTDFVSNWNNELLTVPYGPLGIITMPGTEDAGKQIKDEWGGNVYVMNSDGSDAHLLCHVEDFYYGNMPPIACGDWVGIISQNYYPNENSWGGAGYCLTDMLVVNVVTGEYKFIKYNPYE